MKFRIWNNQNKSYVENSASLHCQSRWCIDAFTGEIIDVVAAVSDEEECYNISENPDWWIDGAKIKKGKKLANFVRISTRSKKIFLVILFQILIIAHFIASLFI